VQIFRSSDLAASFYDRSRSGPLIVSFTGRRPQPSVDVPGFGHRFFEKYGYASVVVTSGRNHWYQTPDIEGLMASLREVSAGYDRVLTYGSSMGGMAALMFAPRLQAEAVAYSPLYSNDPKIVPFEHRYRADVTDIEFIYPPATMSGVRGTVLYDPMSRDRLHIDLLRRHEGLKFIPLPFSGHPCTVYLAETGALSRLSRQLLDGRPLSALARARGARRGSARYWMNLSVAARVRGRLVLSLRAARRAIKMSPQDPGCQRVYALAEARFQEGQRSGA
jgi:pimeloyl-ACP methyl ester carboxylesterase